MIIVNVKNGNVNLELHLPTVAAPMQTRFCDLSNDLSEDAKYEIKIGRFGKTLYCPLKKHDTWHELNYAAYLLSNLDGDEIEKLLVIWRTETAYERSISQMINLIFNFDQYVFNSDITSETDWVKEWLASEAADEGYSLPRGFWDWLESYIDYYWIWEEHTPASGVITNQGYLENPEEELNALYPTEIGGIGHEADAQFLIAYETELLKEQIKSYNYPSFTPDTAWYVLYGFKCALKELGLLEDCQVEADMFYR